MNIVYNGDYLGQARSRLPFQYKNKPRIDAFLQAWTAEFQAIEDAFFAVYIDRQLQQGLATGDLLTKLGKIVGQTSEGLTDPQFLLLIRARILVNRSDGRRETLIRIAALLVPSTPIYVKDYQPAAVLIQPLGPLGLPANLIAQQFLGPAVAAGVRLAFVWLGQSVATSFTLGSVYAPGFAAGPPSTPSSAAEGLGSIYHAAFAAGPPPTNAGGGFLAGVIET